MTVYLQDPDVTIHCGNALDVLRELPDESVHMCCTSPPFYGLRDYGTGSWEGGNPDCDHKQDIGARASSGLKGSLAHKSGDIFVPYRDTCGKCGATRIDQQIGLEPTPDEWVQALVAVFREVRRVLRSDGTCWIEIGDSYANHPGSATNRNGIGSAGKLETEGRTFQRGSQQRGPIPDGIKPKDLIGAPWLLAFALRADGWYLRSEIVWSKLNPMPESVTDRPTTAHSRVFLLSKRPTYYFDQEAIRERHSHDGRSITHVQQGNGSIQHRDGERWPGSGRNKRSVWTIDYDKGEEVEWTGKIGLCQRCGGLRVAGNGSAPTTATVTDASPATTESAEPTASSTKPSLVRSPKDSPSTTDARTTAASTPPTSSPSASETTSTEATPLQHATPPSELAPTGTPTPLRTLIDALTAAESAGNVCACEAADNALLTVWRIPTEPYPEAHFATWPTRLVEPMILAGTSERGVCPKCGAPWERIVAEAGEVNARGGRRKHADVRERQGVTGALATGVYSVHETVGWRPTCECGGNDLGGSLGARTSHLVPATVLDPFGGSGTTAHVARKHGRRSILIELNETYCKLAADRLAQQSLEFA